MLRHKVDCGWSLILAVPAKYTRARGDAARGERRTSRKPIFTRAYFAGIAKIRDFSQSRHKGLLRTLLLLSSFKHLS